MMFFYNIFRRRNKDVLMHSVYKNIVNQLMGMGDDKDILTDILLQLEKKKIFLDKYDALLYLLYNHPKPHLVNYLLCNEEIKMKRETVNSFPPNVWMDLSSVCDVQCRFCKYVHGFLPKKFVTLEQVKSIEWFKYIRLLNFSAGTGETILNPQFLDIFNFVRDNFPHLHLTFLTNGLALNEKILETIAGRLDALHISMNASNEEDYNKMMQTGNWSVFYKNMKNMKKILKNYNKPLISASFVMMRWNIKNAINYLEFAVEHGASIVLFHHYYTHYINDLHSNNPTILSRKFPRSQSLYYDKELSDKIFEKVEKRAQELGVRIQIPVPFNCKKVFINYGMRSKEKPSQNCSAPWTNMYLLWGFKSKREEITICCGMASDIGVYFDRDEIATEKGLKKIWNSPIICAYRRTVNGEKINPICKMCREVDRFNPDSPYPDQRDFYIFNNLPIPPHFKD